MPEPSGVSINSPGDVTIGGDVVGRDKIINNIQNIVQRALTAAETAQSDRELERQELAKGVSAYAASLQAAAGQDTVTRGNPYKGLLTYRLSDASLYFGRDKAVSEVLDRLSRGPLTVVHSESGAGKSSLLQAGLMPPLISRGHLPIYLRPYKTEPYLMIKRAFLPDLGVAPLLATGPLRDYLRQVGGILGPECRLYIFLDQAEELFTQLADPARAEFVRELAECLGDETLNVRWLLAMRTEFFGSLANFRPDIRDPFANDYRLNRLTQDEARAVVAEPAKRRGVIYAPGLIEQILKDLGTEAVAPPELQIVCSGLYEDLPPAESVALRTITQELYAKPGGAAGLLRDHLDRVLTRDVAKDQQALARRLMEALISSENRRVIRSRSALLQELGGGEQKDKIFDTLTAQLIDSRLLHRLEPDPEHPEPGFELAHDYLLAKITIDPAVQARKAAQEMLDRETENFKHFNERTLLDDDKLAILEPRLAELVLSADSKKLVEKSQQAMRRRRGFQIGGLVVTALLLVAGVIFGVLAYNAQDSLRRAGAAVGTSEAQSLQAATAAAAAGLQAINAGARAATSVVIATQASGQKATAEAVSQLAQLEVTRAAAEAADIRRQAEAAKQVVTGLFDKNQLVPVDIGPSAMTTISDEVWVANSIANTIQPINTLSGTAGEPLPVGHNPTALLYDGTRLWVANSEDDTVQAFDPQTRTALGAPIPTGQSPLGLAWDGQLLWVSNGDDNQVQAIDPVQREVVAAIKTGIRPYPLAFDGTHVWVANWSDGTVKAINVATRKLEPEVITVGSSSARPVALRLAGQELWVVNQGARTAQISIIDTVARKSLNADHPLTVGINPVALALDEAGGRMWVTVQGEDSVTAVDLKTRKPGALIKVGRVPFGMAFAGGRLWVSNRGDNTVKIVFPTLGNLSAALPVGPAPRNVYYEPSLGVLWMAYTGNNSVQGLDTATDRLGTRFQVGRDPRAIAYDGTRLWVINAGDNQIQAVNPKTKIVSEGLRVATAPRDILWDNRRLWLVAGGGDNSQPGYLQSINVDTRQVDPPIKIGLNPTTLLFDGLRVWVANGTSNTVQAVAPALGTVGPPIPVGDFPNAFAWDGSRVWVACQNSNLVQAIDPVSYSVVLTVTVDTAPIDLAYDGQLIWVANYTGKTIQSIDPATGKVSVAIPVESRPRGLAFDGKRLWIANQDHDNLQYLVINK